ncbi:hypothetical protein A6A04_11485 [Paramagnetospirillum marisnigri]|uniref:Glycosyltransferase n=1 Tax=Paramagnetospirillum marisnigri TaxID=1285242 RepID=A0A178MX26_9PROT|nr:glycosyltransferase [Paramagnetospirillum marisnigri]OAN55271.1 hypothetical protein A6A04_11485 [Paramagnetospirillum marisnigri]
MSSFSIMLPSLRRDYAVSAIESINATSQGMDYEIVLVAPFRVDLPGVLHVHEETPRGTVAAHADAYAASTGDIVVAFADDHIALPGWLDGLAEEIAKGEDIHFPFLGGIDRANAEAFGTVYGLYYAYFPVISRASLEAVGGWYDPYYRAHFADPDLSLRVWSHEGYCTQFPGIRLADKFTEEDISPSVHKSTCQDRDLQAFIDRWHERYGKGFNKNWDEINFNYHRKFLSNNTFIEGIPPREFMLRNMSKAAKPESD